MSAAVDLLKTLSAAGVEFATDGERIHWRNSGGRMTPEVVAVLAAEKSVVIDFLTASQRRTEAASEHRARVSAERRVEIGAKAEATPSDKTSVRTLVRQLPKLMIAATPEDPEIYAEALRVHGPMSYGMAIVRLGWGGTRAGQAEAALKEAGRIAFDSAGRAYLASEKGKDQ